MKRILYIGNQLKHSGVTVTTIDTLSEELRKEGFVVLTASAKKNQVLRMADMMGSVIANARKVDVVLIDTYSTKNFWYAYFVALMCKKLSLPYVPILHGGNLPQRIKKTPIASKFLFGNAYCNIAPSGYLYQHFLEAGFSNLKYIPNSINIKDYPFLLRKKLRPKLLWVRSFASIYNPFLAIRVFEGLLKKYPEAQLCMVGPEKDDAFLKCKNYADAHNLSITFTGKLEKKEWIKLSRDYDIFLNTTNFDNMPVSVVEAMALGLLVVSTNVGGLPYLIDHEQNGILVPKNDKHALIFQIEKMLIYPEQQQEFTLSARKKAETFDWEVVKEQWMQFLA